MWRVRGRRVVWLGCGAGAGAAAVAAVAGAPTSSGQTCLTGALGQAWRVSGYSPPARPPHRPPERRSWCRIEGIRTVPASVRSGGPPTGDVTARPSLPTCKWDQKVAARPGALATPLAALAHRGRLSPSPRHSQLATPLATPSAHPRRTLRNNFRPANSGTVRACASCEAAYRLRRNERQAFQPPGEPARGFVLARFDDVHDTAAPKCGGWGLRSRTT
jgi:hypothetical protein